MIGLNFRNLKSLWKLEEYTTSRGFNEAWSIIAFSRENWRFKQKNYLISFNPPKKGRACKIKKMVHFFWGPKGSEGPMVSRLEDQALEFVWSLLDAGGKEHCETVWLLILGPE